MNPSLQAVFNIAEICARHVITDVVLSPGSRSAPLTLAFARHPAYRGRLRVVPDERAAAFIGLGIAQATGRPVVLVCTSGTAGLNYAPAVAEAFFQQIPLLVLTADRPPEWTDQLDGQTIRQRNLYGVHAKAAFDFPADTAHPDAKWHAERIINEAINLTRALPAGPVQVNVPLREPFYPQAGEEVEYEANVKIIADDDAPLAPGSQQPFLTENLAWPERYEWLRQTTRILVVVGQHYHRRDLELSSTLADLSTRYGIPVVADVISNVVSDEWPVEQWVIVRGQDVFLAAQPEAVLAELQPELLITVGQSLISKSLKQFLRKHPARHHWHLQSDLQPVADVFRSLTRVFRGKPSWFLLDFAEHLWKQQREAMQPYYANWHRLNEQAREVVSTFFADHSQFGEFAAFRRVAAMLPQKTALHLANSMAVRYVNIIGLPEGRRIEVFANRGTSGIDGCTSTAVGGALAQPGRPVVLLTGDVAFFYDRNAFWHNYPTPNLRVVLFNNHGGGIFRLIDGPRQQPELDEFFETHQALTAENLCRDFHLRYLPVRSFAELEAALPVFFAPESGAAVLEVFTDSQTNAAFFEQYRAAVKAAFS